MTSKPPTAKQMLTPQVLEEGYEWTLQLNTYLSYVGIILLIVGIADNFVNIIVFRKQGLKDGITLSLFALSSSDLILSVFLMGVCVMAIIDDLDPGHVLHPDSILVSCFGYPRSIAYCYSTCITVYLSLERSLCVIFPFKFKTMFTKRVTVGCLIVLAMFAVSWVLPVFATQGLSWRFDPRYNTSRVFMWRKSNVRDIQLVYIISTSFIIPISAQTIIGVSTTLMVYGLQASTRFRKSSNSLTKPDSRSVSLQGKELNAVKMVLSLSIIFFVCNLPLVIVAITQILLPEFQLNKKYSRLYEIVYGIVYTISAINAAANFFVYYNHSSKFKEVFLKTFHCKRKDNHK